MDLVDNTWNHSSVSTLWYVKLPNIMYTFSINSKYTNPQVKYSCKGTHSESNEPSRSVYKQ